MKKVQPPFVLFVFLLLNIVVKGQEISGTVFTTNYKAPAVGASVKIKGTTKEVFTDSEGQFVIEVDSSNCILQISGSNFCSLEQKVNSEDEIRLSLDNAPLRLDDFTFTIYFTEDEYASGCAGGGVVSKIAKEWKSFGNSWWRNHVFESLEYPSIAYENGISGDVSVQFSIDTLGEMQSLKVINKGYLDPLLKKAALQAFETMPIWEKRDKERYGTYDGFYSEGKYWTGIYVVTVKFRIN